MSVQNARQKMEYEWNRLTAQWQETKALWRDMQQYNFENQFHAPLEKGMYQYSEALVYLEGELQNIENAIPRVSGW